ncbi:CheR family methyltransferase [Halioxenophilus aromaticivorans]|uniref:protein-glutamate O-methyltransferase n=1 Tax=Halioxenophilus aromaticivorans TaxID=1306992 RepID=A0AAV3U328_9ALTE
MDSTEAHDTNDNNLETASASPAQTSDKPKYVVAIGTSAGGLEAMMEFFSNLPNNTGAAYIIIQHLSPDFKSLLPEILSNATDMPVITVGDGMILQPDKVYATPPRTSLMLAEGKLILNEQINDGQLHLPIDSCFRSLAEEQNHKSICVVLSGTGSDGSRGVRSVKEVGGLVAVQDPESAKFDGMPKSAINTGFADWVLTPKEIALRLTEFFNHPLAAGGASSIQQAIANEDTTLEKIFAAIKGHSSLDFSQYKASTIARRIERRISINQLSSLEEYHDLLLKSPRELQRLSKEMLIGVTSFFRDSEAFEILRSQIIPQLAKAAVKEKDSLRVWTPGCSSGEEAYSMAMLIAEYTKQNNLNLDAKVFATDIDQDAITRASAGRYSKETIQDIPEHLIQTYFTEHEDYYEIDTEIRKKVIFATHNLIEDPPFSNIDLVSCRNVLIYFQHGAQKKVLSSLFFALRKEGVLFLGSSESLGILSNHFETVDERSKIYRKVSNQRIPLGDRKSLDKLHPATAYAMPSLPFNTMMGSRSHRQGPQNHFSAVQERLINDYAPPTIVVNEIFDAIHVYGNVSEYINGFTPGKITNNAKDIVVPDLRVAVSTALFRCEQESEDIYYKDVTFKDSTGETKTIDLSIVNIFPSEISHSPRFMVLQFINKKVIETQDNSPTAITFDVSKQSQQRIQDLEKELLRKQEHLQVTVEELETTNEELQSANEELMSANEELQSTNEELQSVNEELYTVNSEYQEKIIQLTQAHSDLDSVINATDIGIIFLDRELTIRKYTPTARDYINLRFEDVNRPFHHISHELNYDEFLSDIAFVLSNNQPKEKEISSKTDQSLLVRIIPYTNNDTRTTEGVLITITNVSRLKFVETALHRAQEQLRNALLDRAERLQKRLKTNPEIKVGLLEDNPADRRNITRLLNNVTDRKLHVVPFATVEDALQTTTSDEYDIFLVDYNLGDATARDFVEGMRAQRVDIPVVLMSGYSEAGIDVDFINSDIFDFLNKDDLSSQLLVRSIDYVLERRDMSKVVEAIR